MWGVCVWGCVCGGWVCGGVCVCVKAAKKCFFHTNVLYKGKNIFVQNNTICQSNLNMYLLFRDCFLTFEKKKANNKTNKQKQANNNNNKPVCPKIQFLSKIASFVIKKTIKISPKMPLTISQNKLQLTLTRLLFFFFLFFFFGNITLPRG